MNENEPAKFEVRLRSKRVQRELDALLKSDYERVIARLHNLSENPRPSGCEKLHCDIYRIRVGTIRVVYLIDKVNKRIEIGAVRRRTERTYREIGDLFK
jgi:mRNA interferase RelE/StbE